MSTLGPSGTPNSRRSSPQEKAHAVRMVRALRAELGTTQGTIKRVADQLGYGVESVPLWVKQDEIDSGEAAGTTTTDSHRIRELEQEVRELRRGNAILKSSAGLFAAELCATRRCVCREVAKAVSVGPSQRPDEAGGSLIRGTPGAR